jgi:hypothetical protein
MPNRRPLGRVNHKGRRVRAVLHGSPDAGNNWQPTTTEQTQREELHTAMSCGYDFHPPCPEAMGGENIIGGELRREEWLLSRTRECVDRVGAYDDLSEGVSRLTSPPCSGTSGFAKEPRQGMPALDQHMLTS